MSASAAVASVLMRPLRRASSVSRCLSRGSAHAETTSESRLPPARNSEPAAAHPATRKRSRARSASNISRPSPGHAVTTSTTNDPLSRLPRMKPYIAATGPTAGRSASRHTRRRRGTPRASVDRANGMASVSPSDCDCTRSIIAASGSAMASAGSGRCRARSARPASTPASHPPADCIPPVGNHPVRAATSTSTSDVMSDGSESRTTDSPRMADGAPRGGDCR